MIMIHNPSMSAFGERKDMEKAIDILNEVKELKKYADDQEQYVISALMDNYISHYTKAVWMLKQQSV